VNQFFEYHQTPPEQCIQVSSFYLEGPALAWFQWMFNNGLLISWEVFLRALELRFAPSKYEDPIAAICKLSQTKGLHEYLWVWDFCKSYLWFSSFLLPQLFYFWPQTTYTLWDHSPPTDKPSPSHCFSQTSRWQIQTHTNHIPQILPPSIHVTHLIHHAHTQTASTSSPYTTHKTTHSETLWSWDAGSEGQNLCFNCDERYTRGHRCKPQFFLFTCFDTEDPPEEQPIDESVPEPHEPEAGLISLHAISDQWSPRTFRVTGAINGYNVQILVDSGATHNFIQNRVAQFLQLSREPTPSPLRVMVGNGDFLPCLIFCPNVNLHLAQHQFPIDLYPLELSCTLVAID